MSAWEHKEERTPSLHLDENHDGAGRFSRPKSGAGGEEKRCVEGWGEWCLGHPCSRGECGGVGHAPSGYNEEQQAWT